MTSAIVRVWKWARGVGSSRVVGNGSGGDRDRQAGRQGRSGQAAAHETGCGGIDATCTVLLSVYASCNEIHE